MYLYMIFVNDFPMVFNGRGFQCANNKYYILHLLLKKSNCQYILFLAISFSVHKVISERKKTGKDTKKIPY